MILLHTFICDFQRFASVCENNERAYPPLADLKPLSIFERDTFPSDVAKLNSVLLVEFISFRQYPASAHSPMHALNRICRRLRARAASSIVDELTAPCDQYYGSADPLINFYFQSGTHV